MLCPSANVPIWEHTDKPLRKGNLIRPVNVYFDNSICLGNILKLIAFVNSSRMRISRMQTIY
ncbi:hypothetical protein T02_2429 [Trichinella nativa]|uniref:Uncharacterized protein n=1 Tax=Trichinella nativa TaxID=6335 RepID=A0A0V1LNT1_9BILA|nr:hypothetical protein T02_2429 [Trichinella nativa]